MPNVGDDTVITPILDDISVLRDALYPIATSNTFASLQDEMVLSEVQRKHLDEISVVKQRMLEEKQKKQETGKATAAPKAISKKCTQNKKLAKANGGVTTPQWKVYKAENNINNSNDFLFECLFPAGLVWACRL